MSLSASKPLQSKLWPGLGLCLVLATVAISLSRSWLTALNLSPLLLGILLGCLLGNSIKLPASLKPGLSFSLKKLLKLGIVLLGLKISLNQLYSIGWQGLLLLSLCVCGCFGFTLLCGRWLGLESKLSLLLAAGTSICGASAIVATESLIEAKESDTAYAIGIISLFGSLGMLLYPLAQWLLGLSAQNYGIWVGASLHEVAQVVAAGFAHGEQSGQLASLIKMARVVFLVPLSLGLLAWSLGQQTRQLSSGLEWRKIPIPWFVLGFLGLMLLNSSQLLPAAWIQGLLELDLWLLTLAMVALGLETNLDKLKATGLKPLWLGLSSSLFICLLALSLIQALY